VPRRTHPSARVPAGGVQHLVVAGEADLVGQAHDSERWVTVRLPGARTVPGRLLWLYNHPRH
jgi:hypothetical protein